MRGLVATAAFALAACASLPPPESPGPAPADEPFAISARMSARRDGRGVATHLEWTHEAGRDTLAFATPLGTTLARLVRDRDGARVELADGRVFDDADATALSARTLGIALPVEDLAWWIRGLPRPGSPHAVERDALGRARVIAQEGWTIACAYADDAATRPSRLDIRYPGVDARIVVDAWRLP